MTNKWLSKDITLETVLIAGYRKLSLISNHLSLNLEVILSKFSMLTKHFSEDKNDLVYNQQWGGEQLFFKN